MGELVRAAGGESIVPPRLLGAGRTVQAAVPLGTAVAGRVSQAPASLITRQGRGEGERWRRRTASMLPGWLRLWRR